MTPERDASLYAVDCCLCVAAPRAAESGGGRVAANTRNSHGVQRDGRAYPQSIRGRRASPRNASDYALLHGGITVEPGSDDGILMVPAGLVHHWRGAAFMPGVTLADVLTIARSYDEYSTIYDSIVASQLVAQRGNTYKTAMRIAKSEGPVSAVLDIHSTVTYSAVTSQRTISVSVADRISEIRNAGRDDERPLPAGQDRGYLWRAHVFSLFIANDQGVYVATETLGLSRRSPSLLAWAIEPVARHLGRNSVEGALAALREAVVARVTAGVPGRRGSP